MYADYAAYRHANEEVEGFVGFGFTAGGAKADCLSQMQRKCKRLGEYFHGEQVIEDTEGLSFNEMEVIRTDWASGLRYAEDGDACQSCKEFAGVSSLYRRKS